MLLAQLFLSLLCTFLIHFVSASNAPQKTKLNYDSKLIHEEGIELTPIRPRLAKKTFHSLSDDLVQKVFEYSLFDYASIRLVSKNFRKLYDDRIYVMSTSSVPGFTKATLSHWSNEESAKCLKYQLIPLAQVLYLNVKPLLMQYEFDRKDNFVSEKALSLGEYSIKWIKYIKTIDLEACLKVANSLLRLEIIIWTDIYYFLFPTDIKTEAIPLSWSLGLNSVGREMFRYNMFQFIESINTTNLGILLAIRGKHHYLSKIMIGTILMFFRLECTDNCNDYFVKIISELIKSKFWDLVHILQEKGKSYFDFSFFVGIAEHGSIEGLHLFLDKVKLRVDLFASLAAEYGQLEFLKEMLALELLNDECNIYSIFEAAIVNGQVHSLEFLVNQFGTKYFKHSIYDERLRRSFMLIHKAALYGNCEVLRVIIKHYPYYKSRFFEFSKSSAPVLSPLHLALENHKFENAEILLAHFPELIRVRNEKEQTVLHVSAFHGFGMFDILFDLCSRYIISAKDNFGTTILHIAAEFGNRERIVQLLNTGLFNLKEKDQAGWNPVFTYKYCRYLENDLASNSEVVTLFNLQSEEQLRIYIANINLY